MADTRIAPTRIWARFSETDIGTQAEIRTRMWKGEPFEEGVEYIRADLGAPDTDLVAALLDVRDALEHALDLLPDDVNQIRGMQGALRRSRAALTKVDGGQG